MELENTYVKGELAGKTSQQDTSERPNVSLQAIGFSRENFTDRRTLCEL